VMHITRNLKYGGLLASKDKRSNYVHIMLHNGNHVHIITNYLHITDFVSTSL